MCRARYSLAWQGVRDVTYALRKWLKEHYMQLFLINRFLSAASLGFVLFASQTAGQTDPVTYHDLSTMERWALGTMQVRGAMGQSGSFAIAEMPPGRRGRAGNPHYHTQEQIVVGISGSPISVLGTVPYRLGSYGAVVTPPDAEHAATNGSLTSPSTFIEFQAVLRRDWFPPHPAYTAPKSPTPVPVSGEQRVFQDFDPAAEAWQSHPDGARSQTLSGRSIRLTVWNLSAPNASVALNSPGARPEQFVYVFEGQVEMVVDAKRRQAGIGTLAVIAPNAGDVRLRSLVSGRTLVGVFESLTDGAKHD
jgi:hypothetical protein